MSSELNDDARGLIRDALAAEQPAGDARRGELKRALLSRVAALGVPAAAAAGAPDPALGGGTALPSAGAALPSTVAALPGAGALGVLLAKGAAVGIVVAGALHGVTHIGGQNAAPGPSASYAPRSESAQRPAAAPANVVSTATPPDLATLPRAVAPIGLGAIDAHSTPATPSGALPGSTSIDAPPTGSSSSLSAELALMSAVQGALRDGRPTRALELIDRHAELYPRGQLENERLAAEALAACQNGDAARARRAAEVFLRRDPSSALAERVRSACPTDRGGRRW